MALGIRTVLPEPLDMMIRRGIGSRPATVTQPQTPITTEQTQTDSVPDENGVPRFADGLIDFAKALAPTFAGAGIGALAGGGEGALIGAQAGASFQQGKVKQENLLAKQEAEQAATAQENQISAYDAMTKRIQAETQRDKAQSKGVAEPKYFQSGNIVLRINPDGTQEELSIGKTKGQYIQTQDGKVLYGNGDGTLQEVYKPELTQTDKMDEQAVAKFNKSLAQINDQLVKGTYDVNQALTQAELSAKSNGIEWTPQQEQIQRQVFERFQVPERKRAFGQLSSPMQTEILKSEVFVDAIDNVDRLLDNPIVAKNIGLIPGTLTELTAKVNSASLDPIQQRFYSELKNAFDLLVRNRTGAALSMGEEQFYNTLFGSTRGSREGLLQSLDVQRQSALGVIENAFELGPVPYQETDPARITNSKLREMILADPEGVDQAYIDEMDRRLKRGTVFQGQY